MNDIYKFGPQGDLNIDLSRGVVMRYGNYSVWPPQFILMLQLVSHAMLEIGNSERNNLQVSGDNPTPKVEDNMHAKIIITDEEKMLTYEVNARGEVIPVMKIIELTFERIDLIYNNRNVVALREKSDGYELQNIDFDLLDECIDDILERAMKHVCK